MDFWQTTRNVWDTVKVIIQALLIALILRTFLFQSYNIPSQSMVPTLLINDFLFVSKYSYGYSKYSLPYYLPMFSGRIFAAEPKRGDVIVFKFPGDVNVDYIKRLVGMPGDRLQMKAGRLYINGEMVPRERIEDYYYIGRNENGRITETRQVAQYIETLPGGVKHRIIEVQDDEGQLDRTVEFVVPEGRYFMMGDNRDRSADSRTQEVGYVPFENLVGRAEAIFMSVNDDASVLKFWQWPWTVRTNRLFQGIH